MDRHGQNTAIGIESKFADNFAVGIESREIGDTEIPDSEVASDKRATVSVRNATRGLAHYVRMRIQHSARCSVQCSETSCWSADITEMAPNIQNVLLFQQCKN